MTNFPSLKLAYFPTPGRAEPIKFAFLIAGIPFEFVGMTREEFDLQKSTLPFGQLPTLEIDGKVFAQSDALLQYAGSFSDLYPKDPLVKLQIDRILYSLEDMTNAMGPALYEKDPEKKKERMQDLARDVFPKFLGCFEKLVGQNFAVGNKLSIADLKLFIYVGWIKSGMLEGVPSSIMDTYPKLSSIHNTVKENDKVKEYQAQAGKK